MLQRRKNLSHKQRREQMMLKRAIKRGDVPAPPPTKPDRRTRKPRNTQHSLPNNPAAASSRRLESSFVKLPRSFLKKTEILASRLPLARPVPPENAILPQVEKNPLKEDGEPSPALTCPKRPKWRYDMSKNEVEANEQGLFTKWLQQTDAAVNAWFSVEEEDAPEKEQRPRAQDQVPELPEEPTEMPHAPTSFERNLEVWRQVWRVTEISQILLILLDSRCPTLHLPPALMSYLTGVSNADRIRPILVLTKVDISGPARAAAWTKHLHALYPELRIVQVEAYAEKPHSDANDSRKRVFEPHLPSPFRRALVEALRETHAELLAPPEHVKGDPAKIAKWKPRVKREVDWEAVLNAQGGKVGTAVSHARKPSKTAAGEPSEEEHREQEEAHRTEDESEPDILTIGVIGQPNVGKSSLLNALFGTHKVKASRTPGKTKHFQTLFWTSEVRLVDCPGLIFPNYVPMETQVLSAILPISRVSAIPLCVHHAAQLLPLEKILQLEHPSRAEPHAQDKRTWRAGMRPAHAGAGDAGAAKEPQWTTTDVLTAYADKKGWITARVGRPDVKRAGNAILRALAEGRIRWAFWPPGTPAETIRAHQPVEGAGIWIGQEHSDGHYDIIDDGEAGVADRSRQHATSESEDSELDRSFSEEEEEEGEGEEEGEEEASGDEEPDEEDEDEDEDADIEEEEPKRKKAQPLGGTTGRFGALALVDQDADGDDEDGAEEHEE